VQLDVVHGQKWVSQLCVSSTQKLVCAHLSKPIQFSQLSNHSGNFPSKVIHHSSVKIGKYQESFKLRVALSSLPVGSVEVRICLPMVCKTSDINLNRRDIEHNPYKYLSNTLGGVQASASQPPHPH
jgi:hypothetical protein